MKRAPNPRERTAASASAHPAQEAPGALATEIESSLWADLLDPWFPRCVSKLGGFHQGYGANWAPNGAESRFIVFHARMTWLTATISETGHPSASNYADYARHGLRFLSDRMFVPEQDTFHWMVMPDGTPMSAYAKQRHAYGIGFAIYALAAVSRALQNEEALSIAQRSFGWLERNLHDERHGGYFECCDLSGQPILSTPSAFFSHARDGIGTPYGQKSQNTHLHLLEAFSELYRVWPDPRLGERIRELIRLFLEAFYVEPGWLHCFVERDWRPVRGTVSHGHDVEAAHLIDDAAKTVGLTDPDVALKTRALVDYALKYGWDESGGGFLYAGAPSGAVLDKHKNWWVQAEGLLGLATMLARTGQCQYFDSLSRQWSWIRDRQIDREHGGWWESVNLAGQPVGPKNKGHAWKAAYHEGRGLLFTSRLLHSIHLAASET